MSWVMISRFVPSPEAFDFHAGLMDRPGSTQADKRSAPHPSIVMAYVEACFRRPPPQHHGPAAEGVEAGLSNEKANEAPTAESATCVRAAARALVDDQLANGRRREMCPLVERRLIECRNERETSLAPHRRNHGMNKMR